MRIPFTYIWLLFFFSCGEKQASTDVMSYKSDTTKHEAAVERVFDIPVLYKNWEIGSDENTRTILRMYKAWDEKSIKDMEALLADTIVLDLPDGKRQAATNEKMIQWLIQARKKYVSTSNNIIAVYPIHNIDQNEDWVSVLVYNKWTYKDRVRDSMLYQDLWKVKNGKIKYLVSLEQTPSRFGTKRLDEMIMSK